MPESWSLTALASVMASAVVPVVTEAEKVKHREKVKAKRTAAGKKRRPLPPRKRPAQDNAWKEFKVAFFYSEDAKHQHVAFTHGNHINAGTLLRGGQAAVPRGRRARGVGGRSGLDSRPNGTPLRGVGRLGLGLLSLERKRAPRRRRFSARRRPRGGHGPTS